MRPLTYILGAVAGFFTMGGIGLLYRGYQLKNIIYGQHFKIRNL